MSRLRLTLPFIVLLAVAISACSSGSTSPTSAGGATNAPGGQQTQAAPTQNAGSGSNLPCAAIQADVVAAVGKTLGDSSATVNQCEFKFGGTGDTAGLDGVVSVRLEVAGSTSLSAVKLGFAGGDDVSGLGDAAYWAKSVNVMYAVSKGNLYAVQLVLFDASSDQKALATKIMQSLLSHI